MKQIIYLNGNLVPLSQAGISPLDYGFLYGYGLFETMRAYGGFVFRLEKHLNRLSDSAERLGIPMVTAGLKEAVTATLQANKLSDARIRITVSIGEGGIAPDTRQCLKPTILIIAERYNPHPERVYSTGFKAIVSSLVRYSRSPISIIKSANYMENMLAKQEATAAGADEAVRRNEKGFLAEASMSNVFLIADGKLMTPPLESGILPGITREAVIELASRLGISTIERDITIEELFRAQEAFLTNSLIEIMPLTEIDGKPVASGKPGLITERLRAAYRNLVLDETGAG
ncbi:MAG: aminotransferase class IV [Dehalococcoidales bacterium]|nr:aminotransferase class IV [Dehalococcoidales bacterium]